MPQKIIIALIALSLLIGIFVAGIIVGKTFFIEKEIKQNQALIVEQLEQKINELPLAKLARENNITRAKIISIQENSIFILTEPETVSDIVYGAPAMTVHLTPATEIYYLEINKNVNFSALNPAASILIKHKLKKEDLKEGERVSILFDSSNIEQPPTAKEIKVNR